MLNPIFQIDFSSFTREQLRDHFQKCFDAHDWYFHYSDDFRVWTIGRAEEDYLRRVAAILGDEAVNKLDNKKFNTLRNG